MTSVTAGRAERVGLLGGTFDPPHIGHLVVAAEVRVALALDRVLLVVAKDPWQKRDRAVSAPADRLAMVQAAVAGLPGLEADDRELRRDGATYTADTLDELAAEDPNRALFVIVGQDAAAGLPTWDRADALRSGATFAVVRRHLPGRPAVLPDGFRFVEVDVPRIDVSSTELRARVARGLPTDVLLPAGAASWIAGHGLYSEAR